MVDWSPGALIQCYQSNWQKFIVEASGYNKSIPADKKRQTYKLASELWEIYSVRRQSLSFNLLNQQKYAVAYLSTFHSINYFRYLSHLWNVIPDLTQAEQQTTASIIDIGSATAPFSSALYIGLIEKLKKHFLFEHITIQDQSRKLLSLAETLLLQVIDDLQEKNYVKEVPKINKIVCAIDGLDIERLINRSNSDSIFLLFGYLFNEIPQPARFFNKLLRELSKCSDRKITILMADPAKKDDHRDIMGYRKSLSDLGYATIYPCPHQIECPMDPSAKDWCFSQAKNRFLKFTKPIDQALKLNHNTFASSFYVFSNHLKNQRSGQILVGLPTAKPDKRNTGAKTNSYQLLTCSEEGLSKQQPNLKKQRSSYLRGMPLK